MDWGDACSLGCNGEQYFLLLVDKNTEYYVTFNKPTRDTPVALPQEYMSFTGKPIRFFTNHLMQARVEGAIGICKQHTRVSLAVAHAPARFWPAALTDFGHKRNFSWSSKGAKGQISNGS
jgi:hypothetical protein